MQKREWSPVFYIAIVIGVTLVISFLSGTQERATGRLSLVSSTSEDPPPEESDGDYNSGKDCTTTGGSSQGSSPKGSRACQQAYNEACKEAISKAKREKGPKCEQDCKAAGYSGGHLEGCHCPMTGTNPETGNPYTCTTPSTNGGCTVNTIAQCECVCTGKKESSEVGSKGEE